MKLPVIVSPEAKSEWTDAADWYEARDPGRGRLFSDAIDHALNLIGESPELFAPAFEDIRRCPISEYPYVIYYTVEANHVLITSVFHTRRDPKHWRKRT